MATIADKLQIIADQKAAIKAALENQGKEPTEALSTYAGLIDSLENPDEVVYCVTLDGENKAFAQLYGQERVTLTATENDIRKATTAITDKGYTQGQKDIPAYYSTCAKKFILANEEAVIDVPEYDYKDIMVTIAPFGASVAESTTINYVSVDNALYEATTGVKISDITIDRDNSQTKLGLTPSVLSVLRYFIVREE